MYKQKVKAATYRYWCSSEDKAKSLQHPVIGFGGLGVVCWSSVLKFAGSNPAETVGFFRAKKSSARLPSEGK